MKRNERPGKSVDRGKNRNRHFEERKDAFKNLKISFTLTADSAADISETRTADISKQSMADVFDTTYGRRTKDNL